ncbi:MAG: cellulase family glycosylhydrolase [Anaerolineales bacterium]|nr:cellulase family glycosylhydrolase [Anaerolineales bacterium]
MSSNSNRMANPFELILESRMGGIVINFILIPLLILSALLLPPISLADRLLSFGYDSIGRDGGAIQDPDGTQITFPSEGVNRSFRVKLTAVPRSLFLEGAANSSLLAAAENIPPNLVMKSPYYRLQIKGRSPEEVVLKVPIPNESEPYATLDLYSWNGQAWEWLPGQKVLAEDTFESNLDFAPESIVAMQTQAVNPNISADYEISSPFPEDLRDTLREVNPEGVYLDVGGRLVGNLEQVPAEVMEGPFLVIPTIRNWFNDGSIRSDLVDNMLIDSAAREQNIQAIVGLLAQTGATGIDIDYRGINPNLSREFTAYLEQLRQALPPQTQLSVRVEEPLQVSADTWETGAYDWRAIGRIANVVKVPALPDPRAYAQGGQMEAMLNWATGEINRYKIQLLLSTDSAEQINGITRNISYQEAVEPLGAVTIAQGEDVVGPGQGVQFTLAGIPASSGVQFDTNSGTYWYAYLDDNNIQHTVFLENAASIARKLQFVAQYNLRGVSVQNLLNEGTTPEVRGVVQKFADLVIPPVENQYSVVWQVKNQDGGLIAEESVDLSAPNYTWTAPDAGGSYQVVAAISSNQAGSENLDRGGVAVLVATPTTAPTPTPEPSPTPQPTATPEADEVAAAAAQAAAPTQQEAAPAESQPAAAAPPIVASAVGNLPFGYGIQVDPRGDTANQIALIRNMGFNWVKFQMAWKDVEPSPGTYNFGMWDNIINAYNQNGINVLLSIPKAPDWARPPDDDKSVEGPPQDPNKYAEFVGRVAHQYKGKVQAIEVWNEQNLYYEAGGQGRIDAAKYTELLKASYTAIKSVNPDMIVVSGAMTPTGAPFPAAVDDVEYLRQMYANGAKGFFDAVGAHPSGFANSPDALFQGGDFDPNRGFDDHRSFFFRNTMEEYRQVMVANGDGDKTIWPTEFGWPVWRFTGDERFTFAQENSLQTQAQYTVRAYEMGKEWGWVGTMFLWNLDYNVTSPSTELANFGIVGSPAYDALAAMPK